jgi:hypothetical protein
MVLKSHFRKWKDGKYGNACQQVISMAHAISLDLRYQIRENQ